ncbi:hypothetical protein [Jannaschia sp. AI_61]|nr:hypothetical protein [Jannaschia sp. AI_61]
MKGKDMKRFAIIAAATIAATGPALAYTGVSPSLIANAEATLSEAGINNVDMTQLSDEQIIEIYFAGQEDSAGDRNLKIEAALDGMGESRTITERRVILSEADASGLMPSGENSVVTSVQNFLDTQGFDVDASTLTDAQVAQLYFMGYSDDSNEFNRDQIETLLNM